MKVVHYVVGLACVVLIACVGFFFQGRDHPVSPSSAYAIAPGDLLGLQRKANNGSCEAAYRLAGYHANYTLQYDDAVKWSRIAAACPNVSYKENLIVLLVRDQDPRVMSEVDRLILQIQAMDPERAMHVKQNVEYVRANRGSTDKQPRAE